VEYAKAAVAGDDDVAQKAQLATGKSYESLGEKDKAIKAYTKLVQDHPVGPYTDEAKDALDRLGG